MARLRAFGPPAFVTHVELLPDRVANPKVYPFNVPAVSGLRRLELHPHVTYLVGENGSGKSTLLEAIAVAAGFNAEGGTKNFRFATRASHSSLHQALRLARSTRRPRNGFFLRAESYFNVASNIEELDREPSFGPPIIDAYGGKSLHEQSHGESFLALLQHRFGPDGLYLLDEPEAALSPARQLALLRRVFDLVRQGCQFIIATHAPILMAYPDSVIYYIDRDAASPGLREVCYDELEHVRLTRDFLNDRTRLLARLFED